jgi:hypothetical protein
VRVAEIERSVPNRYSHRRSRQFVLAHPAVASVLIGIHNASASRQLDAASVDIPGELWTALRANGLIRPGLHKRQRGRLARAGPADGRSRRNGFWGRTGDIGPGDPTTHPTWTDGFHASSGISPRRPSTGRPARSHRVRPAAGSSTRGHAAGPGRRRPPSRGQRGRARSIRAQALTSSSTQSVRGGIDSGGEVLESAYPRQAGFAAVEVGRLRLSC